MRNISFTRPLPGLAICILALGNLDSFAQNSVGSDTVPIVRIQATDNHATWDGDPGVFTVFRSGNPAPTLNVYCCISGTASNGVDYKAIGNFVQLPSGILSNSIVINPIDLGQSDFKTVIMELCPSPLMTPVNYSIGSPSRAIVFITSPDKTNVPPEIRIVNPTNDSVYFSSADISLLVKADDPDGLVTNVEFFANDADLGHGSPVVLDPPGISGVVGPVYFLQWPDVPPGDYAITAIASDNSGNSTVSDSVKISVSPPTNHPPVVRITSPPGGSIFHAPINLPLIAYAFDRDGFVSSVEFFDGTTPIGLAHLISPRPPSAPFGSSDLAIISPTNRWELIWTNPPAGIHVVTALATDAEKSTSRSEPVAITILPSPPPPTNRPPIVDIVATDPVAIEGTNCWSWIGLPDANPTWAEWRTANPAFRFFTNCGPNDATFTIRRHGQTNNDLTIPYEIGGTATNGVDYVALPGYVTIPAGDRNALINIVPIENSTPDPVRTVRLKITEDTSPTPSYLPGFPRSAMAIILDKPGPRPIGGLLPDKCFHLAATGPDGAWFHIEYSTNLRDWTAICTNQVINGSIDFIDPDAPNSNNRYYRAVPETNPPSD